VIGDTTIVDATSQHLKKYGWKGATGNVPSAYLTGYLAGKYALAMGIKNAILDIGVNTCRKDTRISAMLCGAVEAGLKVPCNRDIFPDKDRYTGTLIADYAAKLKKKSPKVYDAQFSGYKKQSAKPESLPTYFKATKKAIDDEYAAGSMKTNLKSRNKKNKDSKTKPKPAAKKPTTKKTTSTAKKTTTAAKKPATKTSTKKPTTTTKKPTTTTKKPTTTTAKKSTSTTKKTTTKTSTANKTKSTKSKK
jgi:large subunit ribosomal protein L18